ncbi:MAG: SCO family protein [Anaerolineales bacterium]|nr:SCO family protein [Anaerolineales bacterium]
MAQTTNTTTGPTTARRWQIFGLAFLGGLLLIGGLALATWLLAPRQIQFHGTVVDSTRPAADFTLTTAGGRRVSLGDFRGKVVLLFFGFRFCPDICPTTLFEMKQMMQVLGPDADRVQVLMVTIDPERDTPDLMQEHVSRYDPRFIGLSGTPEEIAAVATPYGIYYAREPGSANTGYLMTHTASITVVDKKGYVRVIFPFGISSADMAADVKALLDE